MAYSIARNIGRNFIWHFREKLSKMVIGSFYFGGFRANMIISHKTMPHPSIETTCVYSWPMEMCAIASYMGGQHVSKHFWTPTIGETLICKREPENPTDSYAVAVMANSIVVGHVPRNTCISTACSLFLHRNKSTVHCTIIGKNFPVIVQWTMLLFRGRNSEHPAEIFVGTWPNTMELSITATAYRSVGFSGPICESTFLPWSASKSTCTHRRCSADLPQGGLEVPGKLNFEGDTVYVAKIKKLLSVVPLPLPQPKVSSTINVLAMCKLH